MNKDILLNNPALIFFVLGLLYLLMFYFIPKPIDINRTSGWGWDITNTAIWLLPIKLISIILFALGYFIIVNIGLNLNITFVAIHLVLAVLLLIF